MKGTYIGNDRVLVETVYGGKLIVPSQDLSHGLDLIMTGAIEYPLTQYLRKRLKPGATVMDIGANLGYFTVLMGFLVGAGGRVIAYEPHPGLYPMLRDNLSINYLHDRTQLIPKAVFSRAATIPFYATQRFLGNSSIHEHSASYHHHYADEIVQTEVEAEPLDLYLGKLPHIDLIKFDIEGGEYQAFQGMQQLLRADAVETVVFELNRGMLQADYEPFAALLHSLQDSGRAHFFTIGAEGDPVPVEIRTLTAVGSYPFAVMQTRKG